MAYMFPAYLLVSSCLGDNFRARVSDFSIIPSNGVYDSNYLRTMANSGSALSEQIELHEMLDKPRDEDYEP